MSGNKPTPSYFAPIIELLDQENRRRLEPHVINMGYKYTMMDENVAVPGTESETGTPVFRHVHALLDEQQKELGQTFYYGPNFVHNFAELCATRKNFTAFMYRPVSLVRAEELPGFATPMEITHFGKREEMSFSTVWEHVQNFGKGLLELGEKPGNTVCLFLETRWEWLVSAFGVWSQQMVLSTVYANLGFEALEKAFKETECKTIITVRARMTELVDMMRRGAIQRVRLIVLDDLFTAEAKKSPTSPTSPVVPSDELSQYDIIDWVDVVRRGKESSAPVNLPTDNDALALIMYTSGTTGDPKGVMHTYGSITSGIHNFQDVIARYAHPKHDDDTYICAMPLAHIFEFSITSVFLSRGDVVCFGSPRTLTNAFARPHGDFQEFKPVFIIGVPRIFDTIKKAVESQLPPLGTLERAIFDHAYASRQKYLSEGFDTPFWNEILFNQFRRLTGGRVRCMLCGGGPLSAPTQDFLNVVIGTMEQGWGMTETNSNGAAQQNGDLGTCCIGMLERTVEMKLVDSGVYKHTDKPEPRGEVCLRGPFLFKGYYKQPELTKEAIDADGWFHTGDVGAIAPRGRLRLVGRVKALVKNSLGEYIPMEALESVYSGHPLSLPNGVCVLVHPERNFITAIVCTDESKVKAFLKQNNMGRRAETVQWSLLLEDPEFEKLANESFRATAKEAGRGTQEIVKRVRLVPHVWSPENGVLTAAGKLKRHVIEEKYKETIEHLFVE